MILGVDHIGIAVSDLKSAIELYRSGFGLTLSHVEEIPDQKVSIACLHVGNCTIELLAATSEDSPIARFIAERGEGIHHIALVSDDVAEQLKSAGASGIRLIHEKPLTGGNKKLIGFLHPKSTRGVLLEVCSDSPKPSPSSCNHE